MDNKEAKKLLQPFKKEWLDLLAESKKRGNELSENVCTDQGKTRSGQPREGGPHWVEVSNQCDVRGQLLAGVHTHRSSIEGRFSCSDLHFGIVDGFPLTCVAHDSRSKGKPGILCLNILPGADKEIMSAQVDVMKGYEEKVEQEMEDGIFINGVPPTMPYFHALQVTGYELWRKNGWATLLEMD